MSVELLGRITMCPMIPFLVIAAFLTSEELLEMTLAFVIFFLFLV